MKILRSSIICLLLLSCNQLFSQALQLNPVNLHFSKTKQAQNLFADSTKKVSSRKFSSGGIFLTAGTGLSVPMNVFSTNSNATFGILGRLEIASTAFYPFVVGGEISYFSYIPNDQFKTLNLLNTFRTKIVAIGVTLEYSMARFFNSPYTIPFITLDVKSNRIKRDIDDGVTLAGLPASESKVSFGAGLGVTLFIFDFYFKYNYMKDMINFGAYAKVKFPVIKF